MNANVVLYVEDGEDDVFLVRRAWQKVGLRHPLQIASNGQEAMDYLSGVGFFANRAAYPLPALMLLDWKLPRMSGVELLEWLRAQEDRIRSLPVVIFSSSALQADIAAAKDLGVRDY